MTEPTLHQSVGVPFTRIYAVGAARGDVTVTNDDIAGPIDSSDEWIRQRTGVITRKRASSEVHAIDLAEAASREAIEKAGISPSQIGAVIVSTISNSVQTPSLAALLADRIGATPAPAYDVSAACAGYTYGIAQAQRLREADRPHDLVLARRRGRSRDCRPQRHARHRGDGLGF
jgi:3-oxoacyl-[acyl-carrier-protein] synthase III